MKCCYKIVNSEGVIIGVDGVYEEEVSDFYDEFHGNWHIAITYEEYLEVCEQIGAEPR